MRPNISLNTEIGALAIEDSEPPTNSNSFNSKEATKRLHELLKRRDRQLQSKAHSLAFLHAMRVFDNSKPKAI